MRRAVDSCCRLPFLRHTPLKELYRLARHANEVAFAEGQTVLHQVGMGGAQGTGRAQGFNLAAPGPAALNGTPRTKATKAATCRGLRRVLTLYPRFDPQGRENGVIYFLIAGQVCTASREMRSSAHGPSYAHRAWVNPAWPRELHAVAPYLEWYGTP